MSALNVALSHITSGTTYSWDLTTLIGCGVPVSLQLRQKLLSGSTTKQDTDQLLAQLRNKPKARLN